jgi:hypothetical protein
MAGFSVSGIHHDSYYSLLYFKDSISVAGVTPENYTVRWDGMHIRETDHS